MGIQHKLRCGISIIITVQNGDKLAIHRVGIPAGEHIPFTGCRGQKIRRQTGIITLHIVTHQLAAIGIILHIGDIGGRPHSVFVVHEHIGLCQTTAQMAGAALAAGKRIKHKSIDNTIGIIGIAKGIDQGLTGAQISSAYIIAHGEQGIELVLAVCKTMLINELIDRALESYRHLADLCLCFFLGHRVLHIVVHFVLGAFRTIADGVSAIRLNIRLAAKAFIILDKGNTGITDLHIRGRTGRDRH